MMKKKTLDKIRIHPLGWKKFLDKLGISRCENHRVQQGPQDLFLGAVV